MNETDELKALANLMVDGAATPADAARLSTLLREQPTLRESYLGYLGTHAALCWEYRSEAALAKARQATQPPAVQPASAAPRRTLGAWVPWNLTVVATMVAMFSFWRGGGAEMSRSFVLTSAKVTIDDDAAANSILGLVVDEVGAKFAPGAGPQGVSVVAGNYDLLEGVVHIRFAHGADVVLAAPACLAVTDLSHAVLSQGSIRVIAPPTAAGFTIATPAARYIDLGTEFGLRVDPQDGASDLYVFDGQVNVGDPSSDRILSEEFEGSSSRYVKGVAAAAPELKDSDFPNPGTIGFARWQAYQRRMMTEPNMLAFYAFQRTASDSTLPVAPGGGGNTDGQIHGARWASGRWPGKDALLFDRNDDYVELDIPGEYRELSIAAWIKVDRLDFELNAIFNSNRSAAGGVHFQLTRQGLPRGGVLGVKCVDAFVGGPAPVGEWAHVAMVLSTRERSQKIYVNGRLSRIRPLLAEGIIRPGKVRLGNWLPATEGIESVRALRGRIDELALWNRVLSEVDVQRLVEAGRPGRLWNESSLDVTAPNYHPAPLLPQPQ